MKLLETIKEQEKEFDEKFGSFELSTVVDKQSYERTKTFFRNSIISILEKEIEEMEGKKQHYHQEEGERILSQHNIAVRAYNQALDELISERKEVIKKLK